MDTDDLLLFEPAAAQPTAGFPWAGSLAGATGAGRAGVGGSVVSKNGDAASGPFAAVFSAGEM